MAWSGVARVPDRLGDGDAAAGAAAHRRDGELRLAHPVPDRRPAGLVGLYIRLRLDDTPQFAELSKTEQVAKSPLREAVTTSWRPILQVIGLFIVFNVGYYVVFTFLQTYLIMTLEFSKTKAFMSMTLATFVALVLILPLAALSDRIGRRPMLIAGSLAFAILGYPLFLLLNSGSLAAAIAAHCGLAAIESIYVSTAVSAGVELFATSVRYSGFSIGYNICVAGFRRHDALRRHLAHRADRQQRGARLLSDRRGRHLARHRADAAGDRGTAASPDERPAVQAAAIQ